MSSKTTARPSCWSSGGSAAEIFITAPSGHRLPRRTTRRRPRRAGSSAGRITSWLTISAPAMFSPTVLPGHGHRVEVRAGPRSAPSPPAGRRRSRSPPSGSRPAGFRSTSHGVDAAELVEQLERQVDADAARRTRSGAGSRWSSPRSRAARGSRSRTPRGSGCPRASGPARRARRSAVPPPRRPARRRESTAGIAAPPGKRQPERLGHAGHRRRGPHRHAVPVRARHRVLDLAELRLRDAAGAQLLVVVPAVGARAELAPAPVAVQHRAAGDDDRRDVRARRAHDARRVGLVAAR